MKNERILVRIPRSPSQELVVLTAEYWNIPIVDIRWYQNGSPTRKGVRFNQSEAAKVVETLNRMMRGNYDFKQENEDSIEEQVR